MKTRLLLGITTLLLATASNATTLRLSPASSTVALGQQLAVLLVVDGLDPTLGLSVFDVEISFDKLSLSLAAATPGDPILGDLLGATDEHRITRVLDPPAGSRVIEVSLDAPAALLARQPSQFTLFTYVFDSLQLGEVSISLSQSRLGDVFGDPLIHSTDPAATITVIPEPGTILLTLTGLALLNRGRR